MTYTVLQQPPTTPSAAVDRNPPGGSGTRRRLIARLHGSLIRLPAWISVTLIVALTLGIGWLDYLTGWEISLFVIYAAPLLLAVWLGQRPLAFFLAGASGAVWWLANKDSHPYHTTWGYNSAMISRVVYFFAVVLGASAVRARQVADEERIKALEELRQLQGEIVTVAEREQQRIGRDLHDGLCQQLAAISCAVRALADDLRDENDQAFVDATKIEEALQQSGLEARDLARGIFPVHVDQSGLAVSLAGLARTTETLTGVSVSFVEYAGSVALTPAASMHVYRIAQEAMANAVRHSGGDRIEVSLMHTPRGLSLKITDNGRGMPPRSTSRPQGLGLRTMRYRASILGAELSLSPGPGGGTVLSCLVPKSPPHQPQ